MSFRSHFAATLQRRSWFGNFLHRCKSAVYRCQRAFHCSAKQPKFATAAASPYTALLKCFLKSFCSAAAALLVSYMVSPPGFQILRIDWEGMKDDALTHGSWCCLCKEYSLTLITTNLWCQKMPEKDVVGNVTSDLIALLPTTIIAYITIWQFTQVYEKTFNVNSKIAQTMQNIWNFIVEKSTLQENGTSVTIREISDSKFIWKLGDAVQNLESAGFPGRVDSTDTGALWTSFTVMVKFFTNKCSSSLFISGNFYFPFVSGYGNVC